MRSNRFQAAALALACGLGAAVSAGCGASHEIASSSALESSAEPPADPAGPATSPASAPIKPSSPDRFKVQTQDGLTFRIDALNASVQLYAQNRKGRPQVRRDISINGSVQDPLGKRLFRIVDVDLREITDQEGRSLLDGAEVNENPPGYDGAWENVRMNRNPGSATSQSFNIQLSDLDTLPGRLGSVRGYVGVELVTDLHTVDLVAEESDSFTDAAPGVSYRVSMFKVEGTTLRYMIEYRLSPTAKDAPPPAFMGLDARDPRGQPVYFNARPLETVLGDSVHGLLQGETSLNRGGVVSVRMLFATAVKPVRFDFDFGDISLTDSRPPR